MKKSRSDYCYDVDRQSRLDYNPDTGEIRCAGCGALGKASGEPTNGGSYFYVCSSSGAPLGYSGI